MRRRLVRVWLRSPKHSWVAHGEAVPTSVVWGGRDTDKGGFTGVKRIHVNRGGGWYSSVGTDPYAVLYGSNGGALHVRTTLGSDAAPVTGAAHPPPAQNHLPWATFAQVEATEYTQSGVVNYTVDNLDNILGAQDLWFQRTTYNAANHSLGVGPEPGEQEETISLPDYTNQVLVAGHRGIDQQHAHGPDATFDDTWLVGLLDWRRGLEHVYEDNVEFAAAQFRVRCTWAVLYDGASASAEFRNALRFTKFRFYTVEYPTLVDVAIGGYDARRFSYGSFAGADVWPTIQKLIHQGDMPTMSGTGTVTGRGSFVTTVVLSARDLNFIDATVFGVHIMDFPILDSADNSANWVSRLPSSVSYEATLQLLSVRAHWKTPGRVVPNPF